MKKRWSAIVKRAIAITLVMLLVLSSVPVTAFATTTMTLYYKANGGTATSSSKTVTCGSTYDLLLCGFLRLMRSISSVGKQASLILKRSRRAKNNLSMINISTF